jgi:CheY-like chemotaxis protein
VLTKEHFALYARDALSHLHDPGRLRANPLAELLACPCESGESPAAHLREILDRAVLSLRPDDAVPADSPAWLGYVLLKRHFVAEESPTLICQELGLGRTSFYRCEKQAVEAVALFLWDEYERRLSLDQSGVAQAAPPDALARAVALAEASPRQTVPLGELLASALEIVEPLRERRNVQLELLVPETLPSASGDPAILRQILLGVLIEAIEAASDGSLELQVRVRDGRTLWRIRCLDDAPCALRLTEGLQLAARLAEVYGGQLHLQASQEAADEILLVIPVAESQTILIIDDNPDTIALYRRYLQAHGYQVRAADSAAGVDGALEQEPLDLVILDVLMPQKDGWDVLQRLRSYPEFRNLPVIVCSVLSQPHLALAMGAEAVLRKPVSEMELVRCVRSVLARERDAA